MVHLSSKLGPVCQTLWHVFRAISNCELWVFSVHFKHFEAEKRVDSIAIVFTWQRNVSYCLPALFHALKVNLLSALVHSEMPFRKTTLLRKQLISPILFGLSKSGKKDVVLYNLGNRKMYKSQCFRQPWHRKTLLKSFCWFQKSGFTSKTTRKSFDFFSLHL